MSSHYHYTPYIWPTLVAAGLSVPLGAYAWRRRSVPGALPFAVMCLFGFPWMLGSALELAAADLPATIFWVKFQSVWQGPAATAVLWFALEYAHLTRWLNRRVLILLFLPWLAGLALTVTNDAHHWLWAGFAFEGGVRPVRGPAYWVFLGYGLALAMAASVVFVWLFWRSRLHRRPAALCLGGQLAVRVAYLLDAFHVNPLPIDPVPISIALVTVTYALAVFHFRLLELIPIARGTLVEQMREGMLVLDARERIVDLNHTAEQIVGIPAARARGRTLAEVFPACRLRKPEISVGSRDYALHLSSLMDWRGSPLGSLILLHDVTEQKRAQAKLLEHQRALAMFQERDRVARELHDSLGQVLGFVKMQAGSARALLARNQVPEADACLARLAAVAQDAHADVREYILGARAGMSAGGGFLPALEDYLRRFRENYGIAARLDVAAELSAQALEPTVEAQLLRIIQEALTNVRKHARARGVDIRLGVSNGRAEAVVRDDGAGFEAAALESAEGQTFGLRFMRERAEEVGGAVQVRSAPGQGTQIIISVPLQVGPS
jgi:signal transduction histidine kinase